MSEVEIRCPHCQTVFPVAEELLGQEAACGECGAEFTLQAPPPAPSLRTARVPLPALPAPAAATWQIGDVILGLYEVRELHEGGGMGLVYRVHHRGWNLDLAMKSPRPEFFQTEHDKRDFERECETWIDLELYPHTVSCYYVRRVDEIPRVFAEYVEGGSLRDWIDSGKLYADSSDQALTRMLDLAIQFAWGLHYAHEQGLVHQDVKPANVMITPAGIAKVTDFGLARAQRVAERHTTVSASPENVLVTSAGRTPAYCSPEQARGERLTRATDIWSWGVSVLEMFTGEVRWASGTLANEALAEYLETGATSPSIPTMPAALIELLRQCFREPPVARPRDLLAVAETLRTVYREVCRQPYHRELPKPAEARADALNNRAVSLVDLGQVDRAEQLLTEALQARAGHVEATFNLGLLRWRRGEQTDADVLEALTAAAAHSDNPAVWAHLRGLAHAERGDTGNLCAGLLAGAEQPLSAVALSPDGGWVAAGSRHRDVWLWPVGSDRDGRLLQTQSGAVLALEFSADSRRLHIAGADGTVWVWDLAGNACLETWSVANEPVRCTAATLARDSALFVTSDHEVYWVRTGGRQVVRIGGARRLALLAGGRKVLAMTMDHLKVRDLARGAGEVLHPTQPLETNLCLAVSADERFALCGTTEGAIRLWDLESGRCQRVYHGHHGRIQEVRFTPGDKRFVSAGADNTVRLWETDTGRCRLTLTGHSAAVQALAVSADGQLIASGGEDRVVRLWRVAAKGMTEAPFLVCRPSTAVEVIDAGQAYADLLAEARSAPATADARRAYRLVRQAMAVRGHERAADALQLLRALAHHGRRSAVRDMWERGGIATDGVTQTALAVAADAPLAISGGADGLLRVWDLSAGRPLKLLRLPLRDMAALAILGDGPRCAVTDGRETIHVVDWESGEILQTCRGGQATLTTLVSTRLGEVLVAGDQAGCIRLWDTATGRCRRRLRGESSPITSLAVTPDGRFLASSNAAGGLRLWDVAGGTPALRFSDPPSPALCLAFSPQGGYLLAGCRNGSAMIYRLATGQPVAEWPAATTALARARFTPEGRFVVTASQEGAVTVWDWPAQSRVRELSSQLGAPGAVAISTDATQVFLASASQRGGVGVVDCDWETEFGDAETATLPDDAPWQPGGGPTARWLRRGRHLVYRGRVLLLISVLILAALAAGTLAFRQVQRQDQHRQAAALAAGLDFLREFHGQSDHIVADFDPGGIRTSKYGELQGLAERLGKVGAGSNYVEKDYLRSTRLIKAVLVKGEQAGPVWSEALTLAKPEARRMLLAVLSQEQRWSDYVSVFIAALGDPDEEVAGRAMLAMERAGATALGVLGQAMGDVRNPVRVRLGSAAAIVRLDGSDGGRQALSVLITALEQPDEEARGAVVRALARAGPAARESLRHRLAHADGQVCNAALHALILSGPAGIEEVLKQVRNPGTIALTVKLLNLNGAIVAPELVRYLSAEQGVDEATQANAAELLAQAGATTVTTLAHALPDSRVMGKTRIVEVLQRIGAEAEAAIPELIKLLVKVEDTASADDDRVRLARLAADALVGIGPAAAPALEELCQKHVSHTLKGREYAAGTQRVRTLARETLERIRFQTPGAARQELERASLDGNDHASD